MCCQGCMLPQAGQAVRACALRPTPLPSAIPAQHGSLGCWPCPAASGCQLQARWTLVAAALGVFCTASMVFLMEVAVSLHITLSAFLPWFQLQKFVFLFRGTFPLVLHNCHTLKHLYAPVCSVNYILKLLNAQPFS